MNGHVGSSNGVAVGESYDANHTGPSSSSGTPAPNGYAQPPSLYQVHNEEIVNYLYLSGFQSGHYADTIMHVRQNVYHLHAIILSRSPFLAHLMSTSPPPQSGSQRVIYVNLNHEPEVTDEGFAIALGYLYSATPLQAIRPENARGALAAGCLLGRMDDLCNYAYNVCRQSITVDTIPAWLEFIESITPPAPDASSRASTPIIEHQHTPAAVFGPFTQRLRDDVFHFLVVTLPTVLNVGALATPTTPLPDGSGTHSADAGRDTLLQIFARVPFDLFKAAIESPTFQIGSDQARFKFAKDAIELRKRGLVRGQGAEETVVLAFGQSTGGSAVHVTRKLRRRPLWKVNS